MCETCSASGAHARVESPTVMWIRRAREVIVRAGDVQVIRAGPRARQRRCSRCVPVMPAMRAICSRTVLALFVLAFLFDK